MRDDWTRPNTKPLRTTLYAFASTHSYALAPMCSPTVNSGGTATPASLGGLLDNCQLIPLSDLTAMVDNPEEFEQELRALDVPAAEVRHPVVYGSLGRSRSLAVHEFDFAKACADRPMKVALPGPYLLTRTMWMDCLTERPYETREELAKDVARVLREELHFLLASGVALVQLDEPVLSEVVFGASSQNRTFMCGALGEKLEPEMELDFASGLLNEVIRGLPPDRLGLHICRGNWTKDESAALAGDYRPLLGVLKQVEVGTLFLELCTERAGEAEVLRDIPSDKRIGVGVVNQKLDKVEDGGRNSPPNKPRRRPLRTRTRAAHAGLWLRHIRRQSRFIRRRSGGQAAVHRRGAGPVRQQVTWSSLNWSQFAGASRSIRH